MLNISKNTLTAQEPKRHSVYRIKNPKNQVQQNPFALYLPFGQIKQYNIVVANLVPIKPFIGLYWAIKKYITDLSAVKGLLFMQRRLSL